MRSRSASLICPSSAGWFQSLLGDNFADGIAVLFRGIADGDGAAPTGAVQEEVWSALSARYYLDDATTEQLTRLRKTTDRRRLGTRIVLEQLLTAEPGGRYPTCTAGARACPPEDCGGVHGYADLIDTLADPTHPEHQHLLTWR